MIAKSFGLRASNSSATRGSPPVMSRVFDHLAGNPGENVAGLDVRPVIDREDRVDRHEVAGFEPVAKRQHFALFVAQRDRGRKSLPRGCCFQSTTTFDDMPVASSTVSRIERPSIRSTYCAIPSFSVTIGIV